MPPPTIFHPFPRLPNEIQEHIWYLACPRPPPSQSQGDGINTHFLAGVSGGHIYHPNNSDHTPSWPYRPPTRLPSLYECIFSELQYYSGYEDTWNLLGACVASRRVFLKMLKKQVASVPSMSEERKKQFFWGPGLTLEEVRQGLVSEIEEVIGWLEAREGSGAFKDPGLDLTEMHRMHVVARQFIIDRGDDPYSMRETVL